MLTELQQICLGRCHHGPLGHDAGTAEPPPLRQRLCHTTSCEPVLDGDDFVVAGTISGGMVSLVKQTVAMHATESGNRGVQKGCGLQRCAQRSAYVLHAPIQSHSGAS